MQDIVIADFQKIIDRPGYSYVIFSSEDCPPCAALKKTAKVVLEGFQEITGYVFDKDQEGARDIRVAHLIGLPPRHIVFKNGKQVGRLAGYHPPESLHSKFTELMKTGNILTTADDCEAVVRLTQKCIDRIDWSGLVGEKKAARSIAINAEVDEIIKDNPNWAEIDLVKVIKTKSEETPGKDDIGQYYEEFEGYPDLEPGFET